MRDISLAQHIATDADGTVPPAPGCEIFLLLSLIANRHGRNNAPAPERETTAGNANLS